MRKGAAIAIALHFTCPVSPAQVGEPREAVTLEWVKRLAPFASASRDKVNDSVVDSEGNLYVTGKGEGSQDSGYDYLTMKFNSQGVHQWTALYDGPYHGIDIANAIAADGTGNVFVTGMSIGSDSTQFDMTTLKYDPTGSLAWSAIHNVQPSSRPWYSNYNDSGTDIAIEGSGNVIVTGFQTDDGRRDIVTIKYSSDGSELWRDVYDGPSGGADEASCLVLAGDGSIYIVGRSDGGDITASPGVSGRDYVVIKYNSDGNRLWTKRHNISDRHFASPKSAALAPDGSLVVTGGIGSMVEDAWNFPGYEHDIVTVRFSPSGQLLWESVFDNGLDYASDLAIDGAGNIIVSGATGNQSPFMSVGDSLLTIRYTSDGNTDWVSYIDRNTSRGIRSAGVDVDQTGDVYVAGSFGHYTNLTRYDPFVGDSIFAVKYGTDGSLHWIQYQAGGADSLSNSAGISVTPAGRVYIAGDVGPERHSDVIALSYSSYSSQEWITTAGTTGSYFGFAVAGKVDPAGNTYVTGPGITTGTDFDIVTMKIDPEGNTEWASAYSGSGGILDYPRHILIDQNGNCYVTGFQSRDLQEQNAVVVKYDNSGTEEWSLVLDEGSADISVVDFQGNLFIGGTNIMKYNESGQFEWERENEFVVRFATDGEGNLYATTLVGEDSLMKFNSSGNKLWSRQAATAALAVDENGDVYVSQYMNYPSRTQKFSSDGTELWVVDQGGTDIAIGTSTLAVGGYHVLRSIGRDGTYNWSVDVTSGCCFEAFDFSIDGVGSFVASGQTYDSWGYRQILSLKYSSSGVQRWLERYGNEPWFIQVALGTDVSNQNYVVGEEWKPNLITTPIVLKYGSLVTSADDDSHIPLQFQLEQNYPNPFNPSTTIRFQLAHNGPAELRVFDVLGREVATLVAGELNAGVHTVVFNGRSLPTGVYFYQLKAGAFTDTKKLMLVR